jgi:hypothetical protein
LTTSRSVAAVAIAVATLLHAVPASGQTPRPQAKSELDAFMEKVLAQRDVNRQVLKQYVLDEVEGFEVLGPGRAALYRTRREFTWYVRDGVHVRSPVRFNGVPLDEEARARYERTWLEREQHRAEERTKKEREKGSVTVGPDGVDVSTPGLPMEPRFVSEAYFMDFKFDPGNYYLAGRETLEGKPVLRIEYYPTRMFEDDDKNDDNKGEKQERERPERKRDQEIEQAIERRMNKTALITLWVDPAAHQIVKYTFDNVWLDFLPGAWLVRVDDLRASMTMGQPFAGVWLPRAMHIRGGMTLANGSYEATYTRAFDEYREAEVKSRLRVPKDAQQQRRRPERGAKSPSESERGWGPASADKSWRSAAKGIGVRRVSLQTPAAPESRQTEGRDRIGEIRVHGNAYLPDAEVIRLAGIELGASAADADLEAVKRRLNASGRFESVDVRKRYRSLSDPYDVAIVLVVHERAGIRDVDDTPSAVLNPVRRLKSRFMFLPIVSYADGYGFTYGGRVSTVDLLGIGERLSVPLTWGGERRASLEFDRPFSRGPLTRVQSRVGIVSRENPRFEIRDQRVELHGRAERVFADLVRLGADAGRSTIDFGGVEDRLTTVAADAALDTRGDPTFPSNAVLLSARWTGMNFRLLPERVNRISADARGYLRLYKQAVLAARAQHIRADAPLPPYERLLLGGSSTVRGFRTGAFDGDRLMTASAEVRVPLTSVLNRARLGVTAFADAGRVWNVDERAADAEWRRGVGGGVFLTSPFVRINLDVARGLGTGDTRVHLSSGFTF